MKKCVPGTRLASPLSTKESSRIVLSTAASAACLSLLLVGSSPVAGATLRVPSEYATIDDGIVAAEVGDTVLVAPGLYSGPGNRSLSFYGKDIVLVSEAGAEQTVIDVQANSNQPARALLIDGGESPAAVVDGFTIINGFMSTQPDFAPPQDLHDLSGGGFKVNAESSPTIRNMIVRNCHSEFTGGGVSIELQSSPTLSGVLIEGCTAGIQGGGISVESGSSPVIEACVFTGNRSRTGGGMFTEIGSFREPPLQVVDCTFASNFAQGSGGGIFCSVASKSEFERVTVWGNCTFGEGPEVTLEFGAGVSFACSIIDTSGVASLGDLNYEGTNLLGVDPGFCAPDTCTSAPSQIGDYGVGDESPAIARNSPCGARIGGIGRGACGSNNPVVESSWGKMKGILGKPRSTK